MIFGVFFKIICIFFFWEMFGLGFGLLRGGFDCYRVLNVFLRRIFGGIVMIFLIMFFVGDKGFVKIEWGEIY